MRASGLRVDEQHAGKWLAGAGEKLAGDWFTVERGVRLGCERAPATVYFVRGRQFVDFYSPPGVFSCSQLV